MKDIVYIHGFLSSPQSLKARQTLEWVRRMRPDLRVHAPALPIDPVPALSELEAIIESCAEAPGLIGSSLGGFYANILAARHGLRAVLVNPAVHPHLVLRHYLGLQRNHYTGLVSAVTEGHFRWLEHMEARPPFPARLWVLLETGDETLDYRLAEKFYADSHLDIAPGGSHAYEAFLKKLPAIVEFLSKKSL
jgi:predicted esterase YcpF (UPF0227 family)